MALPTLLRSRFRFAGDLIRAGEIVGVLAKYGLAAWLTQTEWEIFRRSLKSHNGELLAGQSFEVRVRLALTDLGTTFIKFGQMLSTRPHLIGQTLASELSKLQESTPADQPEAAIRMVESELGRPIDECYMSFDGQALASASIGQVHRARLKTGRRVLVKVQHPGIDGNVRRDLDILGLLAEIAEKNEHLRRYQPVALIREFSRTTLNELDFRREQRNLQLFRRNFADDPTVVFPKPYPELTSGRVLTMEFIKGCNITDRRRMEKLRMNGPQLALQGANIFLAMIFRDGFYHADPHPGNFVVLPDGRIGLFDAGMVGRIDDLFRTQIEDLLLAAADRDGERLTEAVTRICGTPHSLDRSALITDLTEFFDECGSEALGQFDMTGALTGITNILQDHHLYLPGKVSMLIKCLMVLEGTGRMLNPSFNLIEVCQPWREQIIQHRFSLKARLKSLRRFYVNWQRLVETVPKVASHVLDRLEKGHFAIRLEHRHLKSAANRLVVGLFVSSLLVASAMLITHDIPPLAWGVSAVGAIGYATAIVFGIHMLWVNRDKFVSDRDGDWE